MGRMAKSRMERGLLYFALINLAAFFIYGLDKWKAVHGYWRISERTLLLLAATGGFAGAYLGMHIFRHKTKHKKFKYGVPLMGAVEVLYILCRWIGAA